MDVAVRHAPQQPLGCDTVAFHSRAGQSVDRADCDDVEVVTANLNVVDPRVIGELAQQMSRLVLPGLIEVVDVQRLPPADKDASGGVGPHREKRRIRRRVEPHDLQLGIGHAVVEVFGEGGRHERKCDEREAKAGHQNLR